MGRVPGPGLFVGGVWSSASAPQLLPSRRFILESPGDPFPRPDPPTPRTVPGRFVLGTDTRGHWNGVMDFRSVGRPDDQ